MNNDSKLIAEAYFKKLNEGMSVRPAPTKDEEEEMNLNPSPKEHFGDIMGNLDGGKRSNNILQKVINGEPVSQNLINNLSREELLVIVNDLFKKLKSNDQDDESADRTDQDPNEKSAIDYERERRAEEERDKWTKGQGVGGKFHF